MKICLLFFSIFLFASSLNAEECDFIQFNKCGSCDDLSVFQVGSDEACSYLCPNRQVNHEGGGTSVINRNCALKECPEDFPFQSSYGNCYETLSQAENDYNTSQKDDSNEDHIQEGGYSEAPKAIEGKCSQELPLLYSGKCFSCDETDDLSVSENECKKCAHRIYKFYPKWEVEHCELPCPLNKPLHRWDGTCFACDETQAIRIKTHCNIEKDCEVCPHRTILYGNGGNVPSIPNCPKDKPLMDSEGICYACDTPIPIGLEWNTSLCHRFCSDERHLEGLSCVLNQN